MDNFKWAARMLELADLVAQWSKDPSTKVGVVIADGKHVLGLGYNGFPNGVNDSPERYADRPTKYAMIVHSEANALIAASVHGQRLKAATLYTTKPPCTECTKLLIQYGIARVVFPVLDPNDPAVQRWATDAEISRTMLQEAGIMFSSLDGGLK